MADIETPKPERRTKRRYAHELYPHGEEGGTRSLEVEVPYLYARAMGMNVEGTSWFDVEPKTIAGHRTVHLIEARRLAFLADALLQDLVGQEAWDWAEQRADDETGEIAWERAEAYGVDPRAIKPYPCGPEPETHYHRQPGRTGSYYLVAMVGRESGCWECTEPTPTDT